jgi:hypothetical protein
MNPDDNSINSSKPIPLSIGGAYKRKEYGWFYLYIATTVIGARLLGLGGVVGGTLIVNAHLDLTPYRSLKIDPSG